MESEIKKFFKGEVASDPGTLQKYSTDASIFEVRPKLVLYPKDTEDLKGLVRYASSRPGVNITMRAAGSDMTGGPLGESIVVDVTRHMNKLKEIGSDHAVIEPGLLYRDFEPKTLEKGLILPCYPASKDLAALGGMIGNNCGGEKTLRYGKMEDFVVESKWIFSDGEEYVVKKGSIDNAYSKRIYNLITSNGQRIKEAKPKVSKNSSGYYLWNTWDGETFDLNKLLVGSQGTLGLMTEAKIRLVPVREHHDMVAIFFKSWDELPKVVSAVLPFEPEDLETFDKDTLELGLRFMPEIARKAGEGLLSFAMKFLPEALISARMLGLPELVVLVEVAEDSEEEVKNKVAKIIEAISSLNVWHRVVEKDSEEEKFWIMRRESFNLLRKHSGDKRTVPFVEDFCIAQELVPEFLPKAKKILEDAGIDVNIAGHAGNGNFHIIPLMDLSKKSEREKLLPVADKFYDLVREYSGSNSGEHNDGILRTPYLDKMYSAEILDLFKQVKQIFDPQGIFNPGKKVPSTSSGQVGDKKYWQEHLARE